MAFYTPAFEAYLLSSAGFVVVETMRDREGFCRPASRVCRSRIGAFRTGKQKRRKRVHPVGCVIDFGAPALTFGSSSANRTAFGVFFFDVARSISCSFGTVTVFNAETVTKIRSFSSFFNVIARCHANLSTFERACKRNNFETGNAAFFLLKCQPVFEHARWILFVFVFVLSFHAHSFEFLLYSVFFS